MINLDISASGWTGDSAPYSYEIINDKITSDNICDVIFNPNTNELINSIGSYNICGFKQESGKATIYAWGEKPSIDLPITFVVRGGL